MARVEGTPGDDTLRGSTDDDALLGLGGADTLKGLEGNDWLEGGDGADRLIGGAGFDYASYIKSATGVVADLTFPTVNVDAEAAGDTYDGIEGLIGSSFNDSLRGDASDNYIFGLAGGDSLYGRDGIDTLVGGADADYLHGGVGADYLIGGIGFDHALYSYATTRVTVDLQAPGSNTGEAAGDQFDSIEGVAGSLFGDSLRGDSGDNYLWGNDGDDSLYGRDGNDTLIGGAGNDYLTGGEGADTLIGGTGFDHVLYSSASTGVTVDLLNQLANTGEAVGDNYDSIEGLAGSAFDDTLRGNDAANYLWGGDGNDNLSGRDGNDSLMGGAGDDHLTGGAGADTLIGGDGFDFAAYTLAITGVEVSLFGGGRTGEAAGDTYASIEGLIGSDFRDDLFGNDESNRIFGGSGNDTLSGAGGDDILSGGAGNDYLNGGLGRDIYIFGVGDGHDQVQMFPGEFNDSPTPLDVINLSSGLGVRSFADIMARAQQVGTSTVITFDADTSIELIKMPLGSLTADNFFFAG